MKLITNLNLGKIKHDRYPMVKILNLLTNNVSLYETVLVSANDALVQLFLDKKMATYRKNQNSITMNPTNIQKGRRAYVYVYFNLLKYLFPKYFFPLSFKLSITILGFIKDRFK